MGVWDGIKNQFIEVIDWTEPSDDVLAYRFPVAKNEIKDGAQLTVRESQAALFVDEGEAADVFGAGRHELTSDNLPILTKLKSWAHGFNSPFKSEVYFYSLRQKLGQKWGTRQPITVRDSELGSVQLRMFGVHSYHVADVRRFYREISGTRELFTTAELVDHLLPVIVSTATTTFAQSKVPFLDLAANLQQLSETLKGALEAPFAKLGLALDSFVVEAVSLPEALQEALQTRQSMAIAGNLQQYAQFQAARSIPDAARNPSGLAGIGVGVAAGAGLGQIMGQALGGSPNPSPATPTQSSAALVPCIACGKDLDQGSAFCRFCGETQKQSCPSCRKGIPPGSAFCGSCGHKLGA
jgi:membrane protease subunit (stomatin/prohibitin family)